MVNNIFEFIQGYIPFLNNLEDLIPFNITDIFLNNNKR